METTILVSIVTTLIFCLELCRVSTIQALNQEALHFLTTENYRKSQKDWLFQNNYRIGHLVKCGEDLESEINWENFDLNEESIKGRRILKEEKGMSDEQINQQIKYIRDSVSTRIKEKIERKTTTSQYADIPKWECLAMTRY